jgi:hypothetical protein
MEDAVLKWYFSLSRTSIDRPEHGWRDLIRVAVKSARLNTTLQPHMLYDGEETPFIVELRAAGVTVIQRRVSFHEALARRGPGYASIASGAFLRVELPEVEHADELVLYTDCDVSFRSDPVFDSKPELFAAAPQTSRTDYIWDMNTGVMLINVPALRSSLPAFRQFIVSHIHDGWPGCDQENYRRFYAGRWQPLDARFNWKPYWGSNPEAVILHWHGPKPLAARKMLQDPETPTDPAWRSLFNSSEQGYRDALAEWDRICAQTPRRPTHIVIDEASETRVRGWTIDSDDPYAPMFLRFRIGRDLAWEGYCDGARPDVLGEGRPSEQVGFSFDARAAGFSSNQPILTVEDRSGDRLPMLLNRQHVAEIRLPWAKAFV